MSDPPEARDLERRLTRAYLSAFAIVLVVFALAVHAALAIGSVQHERGRRDALLTAGVAAFEMRGGHERIDEDGPELADPRGEGVQWYDRAGRAVTQKGAIPRASAASVSKDRVETPNLLQATAPTREGTVRVFVDRRADTQALARADVGLAIGFIVALFAAWFGGRFLASRAIVRTVTAMRTLRDFTADAAHELRGPLAALRGNASASLRDAHDLPPGHRRHLETIDATARSMSQTIEDLLLIARAQRPLERELFALELNEVVGKTVASRLARAAEHDVTLVFVPSGTLRAYGNPDEIERIVGNLLDNAIRFSPLGGRVDVHGMSERGGTVVRVRDAGPGIAPEDLDRIFERFWRGGPVRSHGGSGLGLAIVRALVERHGGEVSVRSTVGAGSEFTVWLPARPPRAEAMGRYGASGSVRPVVDARPSDA